MKVLLISPLDPKLPKDLNLLTGGDTTFTKTLLSKSSDVLYIQHAEALQKGYIEYLPLHKFLSILVKLRFLPISSGTFCIRIKSDFDLVHCHGYSLKISGKKVPVVISDSSSNYLFLKDYLGWPGWMIELGYFLRRNLFKWLKIIDSDTNSEGVSKLIVFSKFAERVHLKLGVPKDKVEVIYPGIKGFSAKDNRREKSSVNILFVGIWFERKGGPLLLQAFKKLSDKYPNIKLTIIGPIPKRFKINDLRFKNYDYVSRDRLMREFFPKADIFVLVPPKVEGFGFVVLEAMAFGIPTVVSRVCALPELVSDGETGFIVTPGSLTDLVQKLEKLIVDERLRKRMGLNARTRFLKEFSVDVMNKKLAKVYKSALENF